MSVRKSIAFPARSRFFLAMVSALVMLVGMLFGANVAAADSVQVQSYQRVSQTATCDSPPESMTEWRASWANPSDPISGPTWHPSWERWANNGNGGWTCTRSITWARSATSARSYAVGDIGPGGGTVFYVDMARAAGSQFWEVGSDLGSADWGCIETDIVGTLAGIGTGEANTAAIMAGCGTDGIAARVASATVGGYSDWFLPSQDELNQLCKYARTQSTAAADQTVPCDATGTLRSGFASVEGFWSSSQFDADFAWIQNFNTSYQYVNVKFELTPVVQVRAIRSF